MSSNNQQQQQAQHLYFQTDLTKTQIAEKLSIPRRTIHYWIRQKNWDRLKKAANHMPSLLAENCYHIIARFSEHLLSESRIMRPITHQEADTLHKLALTVSKLKNHSTLNENMETFGCFMEAVNQKSPKLAEEIMPIVDDFIAARGDINVYQFRPDNMNSMGLIPTPEINNEEIKLDIDDIMAWDAENEQATETQSHQQTNPQPQATTEPNPQPTSSPGQAPTAAQYASPEQHPGNNGNNESKPTPSEQAPTAAQYASPEQHPGNNGNNESKPTPSEQAPTAAQYASPGCSPGNNGDTNPNPQPTPSEQAPKVAQYVSPGQRPGNTGDDLSEDAAYELKMLEEVLRNRPKNKVPLTEEEFKAWWQHEQPSSTNESTPPTPAAIAA